MKKKILNTIKKHELIPEHANIVMGLSGGPDSLALFHALVEMSEDHDWTIYPVHVNHRLRPIAAEEDQAFVEDMSERLSIITDGRVKPCESFVIDCSRLAADRGMTSEEAGRAARYEAFISVASRINDSDRATVISVAQNANDQAETILFRILRGTSVDGLSGIAYKRYEKDYPVVRPLLDCTRQEIEKYISDNELEPRRDLTNEEPIYTRNKLRLEVIPELEKINPNLIQTLNRLGEAAAHDGEYLFHEAEKAYRACLVEEGKEIVLNNKELLKLHTAIRYRVYSYAIARVGMRENMAKVYLESIDKISNSKNGKAYTELNGGYRVRRNTNQLIFYRTEHYRT